MIMPIGIMITTASSNIRTTMIFNIKISSKSSKWDNKYLTCVTRCSNNSRTYDRIRAIKISRSKKKDCP